MNKIKVLSMAITLVAINCLDLAKASTCGLPKRMDSGSWSAGDFYKQNRTASTTRELAVVDQVIRGNVPDFYRSFTPLQISAQLNGETVILELSVAPDYLLIGTDRDFVRAPLTPFAAQFLASSFGYVLPTPFLVDRIYDLADTQLEPQPTDWYKKSSQMRDGSNYVVHNQMIESQRQGRAGLIAGHKKDVVTTNRLDSKTNKVAIYGWQRPGNKPIQPLALPHDFTYEDYSHGIRILGPELKLISKAGVSRMPLKDALLDRKLGAILNGGNEALHDVRAGRSCTAQFAKAVGLDLRNCPPQPIDCD